MNRELPAISVDLLSGRSQAAKIVEHCAVAFWMHGRDNDCAMHHLHYIHSEFADLADLLGYDITERHPKTDEAKE